MKKALTGADIPVRDPVVDSGRGDLLSLPWEQWFQRLGEWIDGVVYPDTFWDDLRFPAQGINPAGTSAPPTVVTADPWAGTLLFSASATNVVVGTAQMPHAWKEGTDVEPHIHWCPTSTHTGNVAWRFSYQVANIGATFPATLTTAGILVDAGDGTTNKHQVHDFADIDMDGKTISCMIVWKLERVGGNVADTYTGTARFLELDFHYEIDSPGSAEETTKT